MLNVWRASSFGPDSVVAIPDPGLMISELSDRLRNGDFNEGQKMLMKKYAFTHFSANLLLIFV